MAVNFGTLMVQGVVTIFVVMAGASKVYFSVDDAGESGQLDTFEQEKYGDLDTWNASYKMRTKFPYYHMGFDDDGLPVWVFEFGKWDLRWIVEAGEEETRQEFLKYHHQIFYRINQTVQQAVLKNEMNDAGWIMIMDMEDFSLYQIGSTDVISFFLKCLHVVELHSDSLAYAFGVNVNFVARQLISLGRPMLGKMLGKCQLFGTVKSKWQPFLLQKIPRGQLPQWYGGYTNFTPVAVYG